jgi:hypothetical protein
MIKNLKEKLENYFLKVKKTYIPLQSDLYIVEFPKSGTTWLSTILANVEIINSGENTFKNITFGNLESFFSDIYCGYPSNYYSPLFGGRLLKTHEPVTLDLHRIIYIYRNPISVMKSYYSMCIGLKIISEKLTFSEFIKHQTFGVEAWKNHVRGWLFNSSSSQVVCFLSYESLINDTLFHVDKIYKFFGVNIKSHILEEAIEMSSLNNMGIMEKQHQESDLRYKIKYQNDYTFVRTDSERKLNNINEEDERYILLSCSDELRWLGY